MRTIYQNSQKNEIYNLRLCLCAFGSLFYWIFLKYSVGVADATISCSISEPEEDLTKEDDHEYLQELEDDYEGATSHQIFRSYLRIANDIVVIAL